MDTIIIIIIYLVSIPSCLLVNKIAYKTMQSSIMPIAWFVPVINTSMALLWALFLVLEYAGKGILSPEYWKKRW